MKKSVKRPSRPPQPSTPRRWHGGWAVVIAPRNSFTVYVPFSAKATALMMAPRLGGIAVVPYKVGQEQRLSITEAVPQPKKGK